MGTGGASKTASCGLMADGMFFYRLKLMSSTRFLLQPEWLILCHIHGFKINVSCNEAPASPDSVKSGLIIFGYPARASVATDFACQGRTDSCQFLSWSTQMARTSKFHWDPIAMTAPQDKKQKKNIHRLIGKEVWLVFHLNLCIQDITRLYLRETPTGD